MAPVSGRVTLNGDPLANVAVNFGPLTGGLDYLSFAPTADNRPTTVSLGFEGVAYSLLTVPDSSSLVVRQGITQGETLVAGEALLLRLTS